MENFRIEQGPVSVEEREIDLKRQPTDAELTRLVKGFKLLGRFFEKLDTASGRLRWRPSLRLDTLIAERAGVEGFEASAVLCR